MRIVLIILLTLGPSTLFAEEVIKIDANKELGKISPYIFGSNAGAWYLSNYLNNQTGIDRIKEAGIRMLRFPGGSISDDYDWSSARRWEPTQEKWVYYPYCVSIEQFLEFSREVGAEPLITVNAKMDPALFPYNGSQWAAELVRYVNIEKGWNVTYWEIGNEPDFYTNVDDYSVNYTEYYNAMKAVDPNIKILGPVVSNWNKYDTCGWCENEWFPGFINQSGIVDVFSYHFYANNLPEPLLDRPERIDGYTRDIKGYFNAYHPEMEGDVELAMTEWNTGAGGLDSTSFEAALFGAEMLGRLIKNSYTIGTQWELGSSQDFGLLDPNNGFEPRPMYYAFKMFTHFGDGLVEGFSSGSLSVYASKRGEGNALTLLVINKDPTAHTALVEVYGFSPGAARAWLFDSGHKAEEVGSLEVSDSFEYTFPPYSITAIVIESERDMRAAWALVFLALLALLAIKWRGLRGALPS